jgi:multisubunit Na+/H+ antiporter MnhG subunit
MRTALERLHYVSLGSTLPAVLMAAAVAVREGPGLETANACAVALALVVLAPALAHATARAIQRAGERERGEA